LFHIHFYHFLLEIGDFEHIKIHFLFIKRKFSAKWIVKLDRIEIMHVWKWILQ